MTFRAYPAALRRTTALGASAALYAWLAALPPSMAQGEDGAASAEARVSSQAPDDPAPPDPPTLPYEVTVSAGDNDDIADLGRAVAQTVTLRERAPTDGFGLLGRVRGDLPRL